MKALDDFSFLEMDTPIGTVEEAALKEASAKLLPLSVAFYSLLSWEKKKKKEDMHFQS